MGAVQHPLNSDQTSSSVTDTDDFERCIRKRLPNRFSKVADGLPGQRVVHARGAVGSPFSLCGVNCVGIMTVPRVEVVLCDFSSVHSFGPQRESLGGHICRFRSETKEMPQNGHK